MALWIEADTLARSSRGGEPSLQKRSGEPKTLWRGTSHRREIRAWIRNWEVDSADPRSLQVSEAMTPWNLLFFCVFRN
jgi:hypothetical protein